MGAVDCGGGGRTPYVPGNLRQHTDRMEKLVYCTTSVEVGPPGPVVAGLISGIVTTKNAPRILAGSAQWAGGQALAQVADYSRAVMAIEADELMRSAQQAMHEGAMLAPVALVVNLEQSAMFESYCRAARSAGLVRAAFLSVDEALRWAAKQAAVREHWQRLRLGLRSSR